MIKHTYHHANMIGRDYIVGDIHGCFGRLTAHLQYIGFDVLHDRLYCVGDLGARGPNCKDMLWWLLQPWFFSVCGNHDMGLIDYQRAKLNTRPAVATLGRLFKYYDFLKHGEAWHIDMPDDERQLYADAMSKLPVAITLETASGPVGIVHAEVPIDFAWQEFIAELEQENDPQGEMHCSAMNGRDRTRYNLHGWVDGVRAVVVGHESVIAPASRGNHLYIDTGAVYEDREFTILDAATLQPVFLPMRKMADPKIIAAQRRTESDK